MITAVLDVQAGDPPNIEMIGPDDTFPNPDKPLVIRSRVSSCCKEVSFDCAEYSAVWSTDINPAVPLLSDLYAAQPEMFLANPALEVGSNIIDGSREYKIIVASNMLVAGQKYLFTLTVVDKCGTAAATLPTIQMNAPPSGGTIVMTPSTGYSLETVFEFSALGWVDPEAEVGFESSLEYTFVYLKDPTDMTSSKIIMKTQTDVTSYETVLPEGHGDSGLFKVAVMVKDENGGSAISSFVDMTVTQKPLPVTKEAQESLINDLISSNLETAANMSNSQEVLGKASMIAAVLNQPNIDPEVAAKQKSKLVEMAMSASATLEKDEGAITQQAQFFESLGSNNMDEDTGDAVLDMVGNLADASQEVGTITPEATTALTGTLGSFLASEYAKSARRRLSGGDSDSGANVKKVLKIYGVVDNVMGAVASGKISGEAPSQVTNDQFDATVENASPSSYSDVTRTTSSGIGITLSSSVFQSSEISFTSEVQTVIVRFKGSPALDNNAATLASDAVRVVVRNESGPVSVSNLSVPIGLIIPITPASDPPPMVAEVGPTITEVTLFCYKDAPKANHTISNCTGVPFFNVSCAGKVTSGNDGAIVTWRCPQPVNTYSCVYFHANTSSWETDGVVTKNSADGAGASLSIQCETVHLTDFSAKVGNSFGKADDILAAPFNRAQERIKGNKATHSNNTNATLLTDEEVILALVGESIVVIATVSLLFGMFVLSCFMSCKFDADDDNVTQSQMELHIKKVWSASRGIVAPGVLEHPVTKTTWWKLWYEGMKTYHPILSIYYTHSSMINRSQRCMILMIVVTGSMFVDAMFWTARYPAGDPTAKPNFLEIVGFGIICAALNVPAIMMFSILYRRLGAKVQTFEKHVLMGKHLLKDTAKAQNSKLEHIKTYKDAVDHAYLIDGALYYLKHGANRDKKKRCCAYTCGNSNVKSTTTKDMKSSGRKRRTSILLDMSKEDKRKKMQDFQILSLRAKEIVKELHAHKSAQKSGRLEKFKKNHTSCCCFAYFAVRAEARRLKALEKSKSLSKNEQNIQKVLKTKNCCVRRLFYNNRKFRDPRMNVTPAPHWLRYILDGFMSCLFLFYCYFIVGFSFYYGPDVANAWLQCFLTSMVIDFFIVNPISILGKSVFLPRMVAHFVFHGHPDIAPLAATPLMSGAVGTMGPTGQMALAMGLVTVSAIGAAGNMAQRWRRHSKIAIEERENGYKAGASKVKYVLGSPEADGKQSKYVVKAVRSFPKPLAKGWNKRNLLEFDDANSVGGSKYAVVPMQRHEAEAAEATEATEERGASSSKEWLKIWKQGRKDAKRKGKEQWQVLCGAAAVAAEEVPATITPASQEETSEGASSFPHDAVHELTDDHVMDFVMHMTEGQLHQLVLSDAHDRVEADNVKMGVKPIVIASTLRYVDQSHGKARVREHRADDRLVRRQQEMLLMPATPFHQKRRQQWTHVKDKLHKMHHAHGSSAARNVRTQWMQELAEHGRSGDGGGDGESSSNANEWAKILKQGRKDARRKGSEQRQALFDDSSADDERRRNAKEEKEEKEKAQGQQLVETQLLALQKMRLERQQAELELDLQRRTEASQAAKRAQEEEEEEANRVEAARRKREDDVQQRQAKQGKKLARALSLELEQDRATYDLEARGARRETIEKRERKEREEREERERLVAFNLEQERLLAERKEHEKREEKKRLVAEQERIRIEMDERRKAFMAAAKEGGGGVSNETAQLIHAVATNHDEIARKTAHEERMNATLGEVNLQHTAEMATHFAAVRAEKARQKGMLQARLKTRRSGETQKGHL